MQGSVEGTLEKRIDGWRIEGVYLPPPERPCSEAGRPRSLAEEAHRQYRLATPGAKPEEVNSVNSAGKVERVAGVKARRMIERSNLSKEQQKLRLQEPGREGRGEVAAERRRRLKLEVEEQKAREEAGSKKPLEARARLIEPRVEPEVERHGRFARTVTGYVNGKKDRITLDLPTLPVLDERCTVKDKLPARKLILEKQEPLE